MTIESVLNETRKFKPPADFAKAAALPDLGSPEKIRTIREAAMADPVAFWEEAARELTWFTPWDKALEWNPPDAKWFIGGKINAAYNCLDRHLTQHSQKKALIWESEQGAELHWTFAELHAKVCKLANAMESTLGLKAGDAAAIYMPMVPEAIVTMLACARIGVIHSVIFAGFNATALRDRIIDANCKVVFGADVGFRKGQTLDHRAVIDAAVKDVPCVNRTVILQRVEHKALPPKYVDWRDICREQSPQHGAVALDSEHPLFYLYTSGTTGKPKGIVHSTGGYLTGVARTSKWIFDLKPTDIYWCTADIGWITGHSYLVYGMLANAMTCVIYEGAPGHPHPGRIWEMIQKHRVTILYTAPTAIRAFMCAGDEHVTKFDLSTLRLLGTVGEPINPEAWMWYYEKIGGKRCPIVDTWWQTETGSILISPLPGVTDTKPGSATTAFPGIQLEVVDEKGKRCAPGQGGYLVVKQPWPSMLRGIHGDPQRFKEQYWSRFPGSYFTGDGAQQDAEGYFWIQGRVDDVINVSGHRLGTMEIESALVSHPSVAEAAVVGRADAMKGQAIVAYVIPKKNVADEELKTLAAVLKGHVVKEIGALARPEEILLTRTLPKTRSGKIMRRLLKDLADGKKGAGDTTTLENSDFLDLIR